MRGLRSSCPNRPEVEDKPLTWPNWPNKLRTSSSQEEGCERMWSVATKSFAGSNGVVSALHGVRLDWQKWQLQGRDASEADMAVLEAQLASQEPLGAEELQHTVAPESNWEPPLLQQQVLAQLFPHEHTAIAP